MKGVKLLLKQDQVDKDVIKILEEIFLQKEESYTGGDLISCSILYIGIMTSMIV